MSRKFEQGKRNTELPVPPDKRRKTDLSMAPHCQTNVTGPEELWDDDDDMDVFTQDQLESIDNLIASSQQVGAGRPRGGATMQNVGNTVNRDRLVGHGSTKSRSMGEPWSPHVSSFCDARNTNQVQWTRRNSASKLTCQSSYTKAAYQTTKSTNISTVPSVPAAGLPPKNVTSRPAFPSKESHPCIPSTSSTCLAAGNRTTTQVGGAFNKQSFSPSNVDTGSEKLSQVLPSNEAQLGNVMQQQVDKLLQECENYRNEMVLLRENKQSNDGQVKILRASLTQKENELSRLRQEQLQAVEQEARLRTERESNFGNEIEKLKTQLQFKEQEIVEVQGRCKKLEVRLAKVANDDLESGSSLPPHSPRSKVGNLLTSPKSKVSCLSSPKSKVTIPSPVKGAFPNEQSFLSEEKSPRPCCSSLHDNSKKDPIGGTVLQKRQRRMRLKNNSKGTLAGPLLVDRLISPTGTGFLGRSSHGESLPGSLIDLMQTPPHFSHPAPVSALQGVSSKGTKDSNVGMNKHPTSGVGQMAPLVSNDDHLLLAKQALHELLSRSSLSETNVRNDSANLRNDTQSALLIIPLIEDCLDRFSASMDGKSDPAFSSTATRLVANISDSSVESINGPLGALSVAPPAGHHRHSAVGCVLNALAVLNTLVTLSAHVRHAIVCHVTSPATSTQKGKQGEGSCCHWDSVAGLDPRMGKFGDCQLFKKLVDLANPLHFQNRVCCVEMTETALVCLTTLALNCQQQHLHRFESMISHDMLVNCLADDLDICVQSRCTLVMRALDILTALVRSSLLLSLLCVCADECLLQLVYSCVCTNWKGRRQTDTTQLGRKVVTLLSTIVSHHKNGVTLLLTPNCQCGTDVVKSVILLLHRELHVYRAFPSGGSLRLLRDGVALLHAFSVRDKYYRRHHQDVEHQYVELVCGTEMLFRETDGIGDQEMAALLELWDFDQDCPNGSGEEDDEESKASGPVTGDVKDQQRREEQPMDIIEIE